MADTVVGQIAILEIEYAGNWYSVEATTGMRLLDAVSMAPDVHLTAPCGGNGTCGKCKVRVLDQPHAGLSDPGDVERRYLSPREISSGIRLSCRALLTGDCQIAILQGKEQAEIVSGTRAYQGTLDPPVARTVLQLPKPSIEDQRPDDQRLIDGLAEALSSWGRRNTLSLGEPKGLEESRGEESRGDGGTSGGTPGVGRGTPEVAWQSMQTPSLTFAQRQLLPMSLRQHDFAITVTHSDKQVYRIDEVNMADSKGKPAVGSDGHSGGVTDEPAILEHSGGATTDVSPMYGVALDIGTTTVVAYLVDLVTGEVADNLSGLNRQSSFGSDVISRIEFVMRADGGLARARDMIRTQVVQMAQQLLVNNGVPEERLAAITIAGNTTMIHLFAGYDPTAIAATPFIPVSLGPEEVPAEVLGFDSYSCPVFLLPSISGYVGADISAGVIATGMLDHEKPTLLVDIGTNGEIVLGSRHGLHSCSTAAGPAFEGAQISRGMGGIAGAINTLYVVQDHVAYTTIGGQRPRGICGSGIVDVSAVLIRSGAADYTGRILDISDLSAASSANQSPAIGSKHSFPPSPTPDSSQTSPFPPSPPSPPSSSSDTPPPSPAHIVLARRVEENGEPAILLAKAEDTESGEAILFTQRDLREVQLAKAAIGAGIETLVHEAGIGYDEIEHVYLAGGFGSFINTGSAVEIGMFPRELENRIESVGNSAGSGAVMALLSRSVMGRLGTIREKTRYIELSSNAYFQNAYIEHMYFPMLD